MTAAAPPVAIEPSSTQTPSSSKYHHYYPTSTAATTTTNNNNNSNHHQYQNQQQQQQSSSSPSGTPRRSTTATGSSKNANILGSYFMMQTIGEGEFAKVKLAVHRTAPHREVAIKLIRKDNLDTFEKRSKVEREILALRSVSHPNIVRMVDLLDTDRYIGIVMEYASGGELFDYILAHKYLREKDACRLFAQLMSGVAHLHARRIVHRDLKLENLLLDKQRNIIITDFGFANQFGEDGGVTAAMRAAANSSSPMSSGGNSADRARLNVALPAAMMSAPDLMSTSCGSPCYAAPELVLSEGMYVGTAADIWSCGVILYAMLAGFLPYDDDPTNPDSENISQLYQYIMTTPLVYPDHIPEQAKLLLQRILVPDPAKRAGVKEISEHQWLKPHAAMLANQKLICENFFPPVTMPSASAAGSRATSAVSTPAVSPIAKPAPAVVTASQPVMPLPMSSSHAQSQSVTATGSSRSEYATATAAAISSSSVSSSQPTTTHSGHGASSPSAIAAASYSASKPVESRVRTGPSTTRVPPTASTASAPMPLLPPSPLQQQQQQQQQHKQIAAAFPPVPTNGGGLPSAASPSTRASANGGGGGSSRPVSVISAVSVGGHERTRAMTIGSPPPQFQNLAAGFARPTAVTPTVAPVATTAASATANGKAHRGSDTSAMNVANGGMSTCSSMMSVVPGPDFLYESPHVDSPPLPTMIVKQRAATSTSTSTAIVNNTSVADSGVQTASAESSAYHTALAAVTEVDDENENDGGDSHQHQYQYQQQHRAADGERTDTDAGSSMAVECDDSAVFMVPCGDSTTSLVPIQQQQQQQLPSHNLQAPVQSRQSVSRPSTTSGKGTVIVRRREQSQSRSGQQQPSQNRFSIYGVVGSGMVLDLFRRGTSGVKQLASPSTEVAPNITITTEDSAAQLTAPYSPRPPSTVTQAVSIRQPLAVEPISDADDHRMAQRLLKIHTGPIDNSALTSLPPRKAFALVRQQVLDMGLVIVKERDFKIKVVRPIKPVLPSSSSAAQLNGGSGSKSRVTTAAAIAASAAVRAPGYLGESTLRILSSPILNAIRKPSSANQQSVEFALDDQQQQQQTVTAAAATTTVIKSRFGGFSLDLTRGRSIRGGGSGARVADSSQDQSIVNNAIPSSIPMAQSQSNQQQSSTTSTSAFSFIGSTAAAARRATLSLIGGSANSRPATPALPSSPLRSGFRSATGNGGASTTLTAPSTPLIASTDMTFANHHHHHQQSQLQSPTTQFIQPSSPLQQQQHQQPNGVQFKDLSNPQSRIVTAPERQPRPLPPLPPLTAPIATANTLHGNEFTAGHVEGNNSAVSLLQKVQQSASTATSSTKSSVSAAINLRLTPPSTHAQQHQQQQQQQQYSPVSPDDSDVSVKMSYGHTAGNNSGGGGGMSVLKRIFKFGSGSNASSSSVASNQTGRVVSNGGGHGRSRSDGHALFPSATTANVMTTTSSTGQISGGHPLQISISSASASQYHSTGSSSAPILTRSNSTNEDIVAIERHGTTPIPDPLALSSVHHHHHQRHGDSLDGKSVRSIPLAGGSDEDRTSTSAASVGCDYLYGPDKQDSGGQVVFVIELHAIKYLPEMYVVSLTRRKGQLSSYKYLYDTFLAKLDIRSQGPLLPCKSSAAAATTASSAVATQSNISGVLGASSDAASAFNVPMSPQMQSPPAITTSISNNTRERRHEQHASAASSPQPQPRHPSGRAGAISPIPSGSGRTAGNSASRQRPATTMFSPSDLILLSNQHQGQVQQQYPYYNGGTIKRNSMMAPQMVSQYA